MRHAATSLLLTLAASCATPMLHAASFTSTWNGGTGNWSNASKWSTNPTVPNNGGGNTYSVQIDGGKTGTASNVTLDSSRTISGLLIDAGDKLAFANATTLTLSGGGSFTDNGSISFYTFGNSFLAIDADTTLSGSGALTLTNSSGSRIYSTTGTSRLTIGSGVTIAGMGYLGQNAGGTSGTLAITNNGTINANDPSGGILSLVPTGTLINAGTMKATVGAWLSISNTSITNTGGTISSDRSGSNVALAAVTVTGGNITTTNSATVYVYLGGANSTFNNVTFSGSLNVSYLSSGVFVMSGGTYSGSISQNAGAITELSGTITQNGVWTMLNDSSSHVRLGADAALSGTGTLTIGSENRVYAANGASRLTVGSGFAIQGAGYIGKNDLNANGKIALTNTGIINASISGANLAVWTTGTLFNSGTMKATAGGSLSIAGAPLDNTGGTLSADGTGSGVWLDALTVTNGNFATTNGGVIYSQPNSAAVTLSNSTFAGTLEIDHFVATLPTAIAGGTFSGTITQNANSIVEVSGAIAINSAWNAAGTGNTYIRLAADATLSGSGTLTINNSSNNYNRIYAVNGTSRLTIGAGFTLAGAGLIGTNDTLANGKIAFSNAGTVNANIAGQMIRILPAAGSGMVNSGVMKATNGGALAISGDTLNNADGTLLADGAGSTFTVDSIAIAGGNITSTNGGQILVKTTAVDTTFNNVTFTGTMEVSPAVSGGAFKMIGGNFSGTITGHYSPTLATSGTITMNAAVIIYGPMYNYVRLDADTTLNGTGSLALDGGPYSRMFAANGTSRLTIGSQFTLHGEGAIGQNDIGYLNRLAITNNGAITADFNTRTMTITPFGDFYNNGTISAKNGGHLILAVDGAVLYNANGLITADWGNSTIEISGPVYNGNITSTNFGQIRLLSNATLNNVTVSANIQLYTSSTTPVKIVGGSIDGTMDSSASTLYLALSGAITWNSTWTHSTTNNVGLSADVTLNGTGSFFTNNNTHIYAAPFSFNPRLTVGSGFTIAGSGAIGKQDNGAVARTMLTNNGTINSNVGSQTFYIYAILGSILYNTGVIKATSGGIMALDGSTVDNTGGTLLADGNGSTLKFTNVSVTGGNITTTNNGAAAAVMSGSAVTTFTNTVFSGALQTQFVSGATGYLALSGGTFSGTIAQGAGSLISTSGAITQNAAWSLNSASGTYVRLDADTTLAGTGTLTLGSNNNRVYAANGTSRLTLGSGFTLQGYGWIGQNNLGFNGKIAITNNGTINANVASQFLRLISTATIYNTGNLKVTSGSRLYVDTPTFDNTGGVITADGAGSLLLFNFVNVSGGTVSFLNGGLLSQTSSTFTGTHVIIDAASTFFTPLSSSFAGVENDGAFFLPSGITTTQSITGTGTTTLSGDANVTATKVRQNSLTLSGKANNNTKLTITESAPTHLTNPDAPAGSNASVSVVKTLTINSTAGVYSGTIDLTNNDLIIDYTDTNISPLAQIEAMVKSGYNNGAWTGKGITSSVAAIRPDLFTLAVVDNAQLGGAAIDNFDDINTSSHKQVLVKFTWIADINLDGVVDSNDAFAFGNQYIEGLTGVHHLNGDLNYDGVIDSNDAFLFGNSYNEALLHLPEPSSLALLILGSLGLLKRKDAKSRLKTI